MRALALEPDRDDRPHEDHFVVLHGVSWDDYQRILEVRGDHSSPLNGDQPSASTLACAEAGGADVMLTTEDGILSVASRHTGSIRLR